MSLSVDRLRELERVISLFTGENSRDAAVAIRELIAIKERQSKGVHSCKIPGCMSCGNPPDMAFDTLDDADEDLQALMDRDMED